MAPGRRGLSRQISVDSMANASIMVAMEAQSLTARLSCVCLMLISLVLVGCDSEFIEPGHPPACDCFRTLLGDPIPASVTKLQGKANTWQGYNVWLRFNASKADIDALIAQGFKPTTWKSVSFRFNLGGGNDPFTPVWDPASISTKECYELREVSNDWTHSGWHSLVIDRSRATVYFYGIGT